MGFWDGSGISWTICKQSAPRSRPIGPNHTSTPSLNFYRLDALPGVQRTVSKHWRQIRVMLNVAKIFWISRVVTHRRTHLTALFPVLPGWAGTRKVKPIWILLKQETVSGSGISWAICKLPPTSRHNHASTQPLSFLQARCPSCRQPTASKHWRHSRVVNEWNMLSEATWLPPDRYQGIHVS